MFVGVLRGQAFPSAGRHVRGSAHEVLNFKALRDQSVPNPARSARFGNGPGTFLARFGDAMGTQRARSWIVLDRLGRFGRALDRSQSLLNSLLNSP